MKLDSKASETPENTTGTIDTSDTGETKAPAQWEGAFAAFSDALEGVKRNPKPALLVAMAYLVVDLIGRYGGINDKLPHGDTYQLTAFLTLVFLLAIPRYALAIADKKSLSLGEFLRLDAAKYLVLFFVTLLSTIAIFVAAMAFIVPVIWVGAWLYLASYIVVDQDKGIIESLGESKRLTENHKSKVWGVIGATLLLTLIPLLLNLFPIVGQSLSMVGSAFIAILSGGASAMLYRWLQHHASDES